MNLFEKPEDADYFMGIVKAGRRDYDVWQAKDKDDIIFSWSNEGWAPLTKRFLLEMRDPNELGKGLIQILNEDDPSVSPNSGPWQAKNNN